MRTAICAMKKHTTTNPNIDRTVCQGVEARQTVSRSGTGVNGTWCSAWDDGIGCMESPGYPLSSPINRH